MLTIQAGNPATLKQFEPEADGLCWAIQTVFPLHTESAFLEWPHRLNCGRIHLSICYKYDFSLMADDLVECLGDLLSRPEGKRETMFGSNTFNAYWNLEWRDGALHIKSYWRECSLPRELCSLLGDATIALDDFLREWRRPLRIILDALLDAGYEAGKLEGLRELQDVVAREVGRRLLARLQDVDAIDERRRMVVFQPDIRKALEVIGGSQVGEQVELVEMWHPRAPQCPDFVVVVS